MGVRRKVVPESGSQEVKDAQNQEVRRGQSLVSGRWRNRQNADRVSELDIFIENSKGRCGKVVVRSKSTLVCAVDKPFESRSRVQRST
jgi:hypothetical protein